MEGGAGRRYHEWLIDVGAWELSDPALPTYSTGSPLDKFVRLPGFEFPDSFLRPKFHALFGEGIGHEANYYPAVTFPFLVWQIAIR